MTLNQVAAALIAAAILIGEVAYRHEHPVFAAAHAATATRAAATGAEIRSAGPDFRAIVRRYGPAVVNISTEGTIRIEAPLRAPMFDSERQLLRMPVPPAEIPTQGQGSGFVVSADGLVLTSAHVVDGASRVTVKLTDRREFEAKVLGTDPITDVAVLKIDARNLPTVRIGNPDDLRPGEWVLAIGSPFGFENSVTAGIVSAKGRALPGEGYVPFIQTDVPVNPGNSGGPLFNLNGEVIGINSQIFTATGGYQGLSFAIPIEVAVRIEKQILAAGRAAHAALGVTIQDVSQPLAQSFGLDKPEGALVSSVAPHSAAARAGLEPGDVIVAANGKPIVDAGDLPALLATALPGEHLTLAIWRADATRKLDVTLGEAKVTVTAHAASETPAASAQLELTVRPLRPEERREASVDRGVVVVDAGGAAARAGIQPGDIILALNATPVKSVDELRALLGKSTRGAALLIQRGDAAIFVPIRSG